MPATYPAPPLGIMAFARRFASDELCADYLFSLRYPKGYACLKCGSVRAWKVSQQPAMMICENGHKVSVTAGTAMHGTKQPLTLWFHAAWLVATRKQGISTVQFQHELGLTRLETAWTMLNKLRVGLYAPGQDKLTTTCKDPQHRHHWIEVDEVHVGGTEEGKKHRGSGSDTTPLVAIAVEVHSWHGMPDTSTDEAGEGPKQNTRKGYHTKSGRCRMGVIDHATGETLAGFIRENVARGSKLSTDTHSGYKQAARDGYRRRVTIAKHPEGPLPTVGRVISNLNRWLIGKHKGAVLPQHLQAYLNEYVFRFNRRDMPWVAFNCALGLAALNRPALEQPSPAAARSSKSARPPAASL